MATACIATAGHEKPWYFSTLVAFMAADIPLTLGISPGALTRDIHTLERRLSSEGESFVTKTLPKLGKAIDLALQGNVPLSCREFGRTSRKDARPSFLKAVLKRVFLDTGWVAVNPCLQSISLLRQICYWGKKIEKGYTDELLRQAVDDFKTVDSSLPSLDTVLGGGILGCAQALVQDLFRDARADMVREPRHGPGAVAGGEDVVTKRSLKRCFKKLERVFRPIPWFASLRDAAENYEVVTGRMQCEYGLSRTEFVEKDSGGPRTIGLEQAEYMWVQQAIKCFLYTFIELFSFAKGQINFTDQSVNRNLTSEWADWVTLDMSKASDRVSYALVKALFLYVPWLWRMLDASRSPGTLLPSGEVLWFRKFAPMGSAVCFPIEAIAFYTLAVASLHRQGVPLSLARRSVFVYGDDLIVPVGYHAGLIEDFEQYSLKFNLDKCCVHGKFRESCGRDAYAGYDVTPVRLRKAYPKNSTFALFPLIEHANSLFQRGYRSASRQLRQELLSRYPFLRKIPVNPRDDLPFFYWYDPDAPDTLRYKMEYGGMCSVKGWTFEPKRVRTKEADERKYLRESLSRGGPVGRFIKRKNRFGQKVRVRELDVRFAGAAKLTKFWVLPPIKSEDLCPRLTMSESPAERLKAYQFMLDKQTCLQRAIEKWLTPETHMFV